MGRHLRSTAVFVVPTLPANAASTTETSRKADESTLRVNEYGEQTTVKRIEQTEHVTALDEDQSVGRNCDCYPTTSQRRILNGKNSRGS